MSGPLVAPRSDSQSGRSTAKRTTEAIRFTRPMADPAYEQAAEGLGAKLLTGQREDEGAGDIPESSAGHGQERTVVWSAQV